MPDIDLDPNSYREKGKRVIRYVSGRPYNFAAYAAGVWLVVGGMIGASILPPAMWWLVALIAVAPGVAVLVTAVLLLDETDEYPEEYRLSRLRRRRKGQKRARKIGPADLQWQRYWDD